MAGIMGYLCDRALACCVWVGMGLLMIVLAACGSNDSSGGGSAAPTATPTTTIQGAVNCGSLHAIQLHIVPADQNFAKQDETCFWQAYLQCHAARLSYSQVGVDAGMIHNFSLKSVNGTCSIVDNVQHFIAPNPPIVTGTYTCGNMKLEFDGLHISSCGQENNVFIPLASTE